MTIVVRLHPLVIAYCLLLPGCQTPLALHRNTAQLGDTVADIHQQQILDNLAKFVADPYALPSFAVASSGSSDITDSCNGGLSVSWIATGFERLGLDLMGSRQKMNTWTVTPITDPGKLELMRCAYQRAVSQCTGVRESNCCPNCQKRFNEFYTGRAEPPENESNKTATSVDPTSSELPLPCEACGNGNASTSTECNGCPSEGSSVDSDCLNAGYCWFRWGCKSCVPKNCGYVGHHCGTYVWVPPGVGRDELAKLTLAILDYATNDDTQLPTKEVTAYILADGTPTNEASANFVVKATIHSDDKSRSVIKSDLIPNSASKSTARSRGPEMSNNAVENAIRDAPALKPLPRQRTPVPSTNLLYLQQQLNTVR